MILVTSTYFGLIIQLSNLSMRKKCVQVLCCACHGIRLNIQISFSRNSIEWLSKRIFEVICFPGRIQNNYRTQQAMTRKLFHTLGGFYRLARPTIKTILFNRELVSTVLRVNMLFSSCDILKFWYTKCISTH